MNFPRGKCALPFCILRKFCNTYYREIFLLSSSVTDKIFFAALWQDIAKEDPLPYPAGMRSTLLHSLTLDATIEIHSEIVNIKKNK